MKNVDAFVDLCKRVIADHDAGLVGLYVAAEKIYKQTSKHSLEDDAHPMLYEVSDLAFDIVEDYRSEKVDKVDWENITNTIRRYIEGDWEPTCWILTAMYGEYSGDKLASSNSVVVRRQNGETVIETAADELKRELNRVIKRLNTEQTDKRYLQNLAKLIPPGVEKYGLASIGVSECLTEPYYAAAI
jgi:hypothetical protein